jgi:predicted MFS family arabinose efflux permease
LTAARTEDHNPAAAAGSSAWAPFRFGVFRAMWGAQFVSNIGGWMQTVGAQWLMLSLTTAAAPVALIQTAASLPVLLFAVPAGAVGDLVDRRRFLLVAQTFMLVAALALGLLALAGLVTPFALLALVFVLGSGQAWTSPTWQSLQPELVPAAERPQAIALGSVNMNLARAVGPAIGGLLVAAVSVGAVFLINAATFLAVIAVVARWRGGSRPRSAVAPEHVGEAIRAGGRYVAASPALRVVLLRAALFVFFASSIWALLPLAARSDLHLGSGGYGLLLGCVGVGAVAGAALLPRLRSRLTPGAMLAAGSVAVGGLALVLAYVRVTAIVGVALAVGGTAWILALSTLSSLYQSSLPQWVKARGMGFYLVVFQGGNAIGSAVMGIAAQAAGLSATLLVAAIGLALGPLVGRRFPFRSLAPEDLLPAGDWPVPALSADLPPDGPVMVSVEHRPRPGLEDSLLAALHDSRWSRRRTGATAWRVWRDSAQPDRFVEQFVVGSWDEHLRQHERATVRDQQRLDRIIALTDPARPSIVTHWLAPRPPVEPVPDREA